MDNSDRKSTGFDVEDEIDVDSLQFGWSIAHIRLTNLTAILETRLVGENGDRESELALVDWHRNGGDERIAVFESAENLKWGQAQRVIFGDVEPSFGGMHRSRFCLGMPDDEDADSPVEIDLPLNVSLHGADGPINSGDTARLAVLEAGPESFHIQVFVPDSLFSEIFQKLGVSGLVVDIELGLKANYIAGYISRDFFFSRSARFRMQEIEAESITIRVDPMLHGRTDTDDIPDQTEWAALARSSERLEPERTEQRYVDRLLWFFVGAVLSALIARLF